MVTGGIELLRDRRGSETTSLKDIADHFVDFVERFPNEVGTVDKLARFLAGVEDIEHEHPGRQALGSDA